MINDFYLSSVFLTFQLLIAWKLNYTSASPDTLGKIFPFKPVVPYYLQAPTVNYRSEYLFTLYTTTQVFNAVKRVQKFFKLKSLIDIP